MSFFLCNSYKNRLKAQNQHDIRLGVQAEKMALKHLKNKGLTLIATNYYSRFGEIDLIMQDKAVIVFVEVRCRQANAQVSALESISPEKIAKITQTAEHYLMRYDELPECRFDIVAITINAENRKTAKKNAMGYNLKWIQQAF